MVPVPKNQDFKANPSVYYPVYNPEGVTLHCRHCEKTRNFKNTRLDIAIRIMEFHERGAHNMGKIPDDPVEVPVTQEVAHNEPGVTSVSQEKSPGNPEEIPETQEVAHNEPGVTSAVDIKM